MTKLAASIGPRALAWTAAGLALLPATVDARKPLPYVEIVQPQKKRVRVLDVRWAMQVGGGFALGQRAPVLALAQTGHIAFVELSRAMQLHAAYGLSGYVDTSPGWSRRRGLLGADLGVGLSRHVPGGPAIVATVTGGPRWATDRGARPDATAKPSSGFSIDGWGIVGQVEAYPFYATIPELATSDLGWFRRYVLSGLHVWVGARYDVLGARRSTPSYLAGAGFDLGRAVLLPILVRLRG